MEKAQYLLITLIALAALSCGSHTETARADVDEEDVVLTEEIKPEVPDCDEAGIDSLLNDYEKLVGKYDRCVADLKSGRVDIDSVTGMTTVVQSLQSDLKSLKPVMNVRQLQRLKKLVSKLTSSAARMSELDSEASQPVE